MTDLLAPDGLLLVALLLAAGGLAGLAAGLFGIGGGFVVVPALLAIFAYVGIDPEVSVHTAIGTSLGTIILTSLRSVAAHARRGAVDFEVLRDWAPWIVAGVLASLVVASDAEGSTLIVVFAIGLLVLSPAFLLPGIFARVRLAETMPRGALRAGLASGLGAMSALLGIGGGTIAILIMTFSGRPIHQAVATAAGFGTIIAIPGAIGFAYIGQGTEGLPPFSLGYLNLLALGLIVSTSMLTAPIGANLAHRLPPFTLKRVFAIYLILTAVLMLIES